MIVVSALLLASRLRRQINSKPDKHPKGVTVRLRDQTCQRLTAPLPSADLSGSLIRFGVILG